LAFLKSIPSSLTDDALLARYKATGDHQFVAALFQRYMDLIYGVCLKYLKHPENAQDSTLAIYEELCNKLLRHEVQNVKSWLYTLVKNHCLMRLRSAKVAPATTFDLSLVQSEEEVHLNEVLEKEASFQQLARCLDKLSAEQKKAIELFYLEGRCYNEIAEQTGLEWSQVRSFIQNGRRNLKLCMEKHKTSTIAT
jgi:RNA polymerase sigma factor (sigma-70 family)